MRLVLSDSKKAQMGLILPSSQTSGKIPVSKLIMKGFTYNGINKDLVDDLICSFNISS